MPGRLPRTSTMGSLQVRPPSVDLSTSPTQLEKPPPSFSKSGLNRR